MRFIGEKGAKRLDEREEATTRLDNLGVARDMESSGKDAKAIKLATGWERGADGKWRYETMDFKLVEEALGKARRLDEVVEDSELFAAYPELGGVAVEFADWVALLAAIMMHRRIRLLLIVGFCAEMPIN
jgi:hypothetical protein